MKLIIAIISFSIAIFLASFIDGCSRSKEYTTYVTETHKIYDVRTLKIDGDITLAYLPPMRLWLCKYRPPVTALTADIYKHSVLGFTTTRPIIADVYNEPDWLKWKWYKVTPDNTYYFDEPLPAVCTSGIYNVTITDIGTDSTGTYIILKIGYYK